MSTTPDRAEAQRQQARQDLADLDRQLAEGELDSATAGALRNVYQSELDEADRAAAEISPDGTPVDAGWRPTPRWVVGTLIVVVVSVGLIVAVPQFLRERGAGPITGGFEGVARAGFTQAQGANNGFDPSAYSDETLESVVAANPDDPQIAGMRIALADRYFERGDYQAAFPHYRAVLEAEPAAPTILVATALTRLGWIVYAGNGEAELALGLLERALEVVPGDPSITYLKAIVLWCGQSQTAEAVDLMEQVLASPDLDDEEKATVEGDLNAARADLPCS